MSQTDRAEIYGPAGYESDDTDDEYGAGGLYSSTAGGRFEDERIKIVPHIGWHAGLGERDFDIELDDSIATWFEGFKESFKTFKKGPLISQRLQMFYLNAQNPFEWALKLFANCADHSSPKSNSLAYTVIEELSVFKKNHNPDTGSLINDNLRMIAFNFVAKQGHCTLFSLVVDTFELNSCRELFIPKVREMIERNQYKEAGQIAIDLKMFDEFDEHAFVIPLFMQDKISIAEDFLNKAVRLQRPVVQLLDSFFDKKESVENHCSKYIQTHNVTDVYYNKLHHKPLSKLVQRLAKNYNIPKEFTPNVNKMKNFGALQFLVHKRYYEKSLNRDSWDEMVRDTLSESDQDLQLELVCFCSSFNDHAEAAKWARYYQLKLDDLPLQVQDYIVENDGVDTRDHRPSEEELWDNTITEAIHTLTLDASNVHLVDSREKFYAMITDLTRQPMVAFDSEWKPTFGGAKEVSLIQLATRESIYLIDVMVNQLEGSDWASLARNVFNKDDILKVAFAPATDVSMFQKALPAFNVNYSPQTSSAILDLQDLWRYVANITSFRFPFQEEVISQNLANLTKLCLGKKLDKSNQFSNWAQRPLRKEQLQYAALDAFCLLEIYDVIERQLSKIQIDPNEVLNALLSDNKSFEVGKKRTVKPGGGGGESSRKGNRNKYNRQQTYNDGEHSSARSYRLPNRSKSVMVGSFEQHPGPNLESVLVSDVRFVCDNMLEGLAKMLRRFGIDTVAIKSTECHDRCVFVALQDKRFVLTRGANFNKFSEYVPPGYCYKVSNDRVEDQLLEVLRYYKVVIQQKNIFSRCQLCNCGKFLSASPEDVYFLKNREEMPQSVRECYHKGPLVNEQRIKLDRSWILDALQEQHRNSGQTSSGVKIDATYVNDTVIANVDVFYVCDGCGRCYWDGSHLDNILAGKLADLLTLSYD